MRRRAHKDTALGRSVSRPSAFADYYDAHCEALLKFFLRRTFDVEVARDLLAETFAKAFQHRARFRGGSDEEAAAWLFAIARRELSHWIRRGTVERRAVQALGIGLPTVAEDDYAQVIEWAGLADLRTSVAVAFSALSPDQQTAVKMRVVDDVPYPEIARRLAVTEQTARARVSRGIRRLADAIDAERYREEFL